MKSLDKFYNDKSKPHGKTYSCIECLKAYYQANKSKKLEYDKNRRIHLKSLGIKSFTENKRETHYLNRYGIKISDYNDLYNKQNGLCKICHKAYNRLHIDHCHKTGKVRGLLCPSCNKGLGHFYDDFEIIENALKYIKE